jgi:hypothetical protein
MSISVRYCTQNDAYYVQIQGTEYVRLQRRVKHITKELCRRKNIGRTEECDALEQRRKELIEEKQQAQCYVLIPPEDIPENTHIRPICKRPTEILLPSPEHYARLLSQLQICAENRVSGEAK